MRKRTKQITQFSIGLAAILGLAVSSIAACACSHHRTEAESTPSCHQSSKDHQSNEGEKIDLPAYSESCICAPRATKLSVKADDFKLKKQAAVIAVALTPAPGGFRLASIASSFHRATPSYQLRFDGAIFTRGPPAL